METDLQIRQATPADAPGILAIYGPICETSPISFEIKSPTVAEMEERINKITSFFPWLVVTRGDSLLGYAYTCPHRERAAYRWAVDTAVYIHSEARRSGLGTRLYEALFVLARAQGFYRAYAGITLPNPASIRLHQKAHFVSIGIYHQVGYKSRRWHDVEWFEATLRSEADQPLEPSGIKELPPEVWTAARRAALSLGRP